MIPVPYTVSLPELAKKPGLCGVCESFILVGSPMVICRYGVGAHDWAKAHAGCAKEIEPPREPTAITQHEVTINSNRGSHTVTLNGKGVYYSTRKEMADGVVEFLNVNPEVTDWLVSWLKN